MNKEPQKGEIVIFKSKDNTIRLDVTLVRETVWLSQKQIATLFGTQRPAVTKHINNIFKDKELSENSVCSILEHTAKDGKIYKTSFYNLDAIISVGYRVNSHRATQFRVWATGVLKKHLIDGYTLNGSRLAEAGKKFDSLKKAIKLIQEVRTRKELDYKEAVGILDVLSDYAYALDLLDGYDKKSLKVTRTSGKTACKLTFADGMNIVAELKKKFGGSSLFGMQKDDSFKSSLAVIYQTCGRKELYPSVEEKAANLLYFIVKNHSFIDGNKRIAAAIFLWFLEKNRILYKDDGTKRVADNALVALTLLMAESHPAEREVIVTLVVNLINENN